MEVLREEMIRQRPNIIKDMDCFSLCWEVSRVIEKAKFGKAKGVLLVSVWPGRALGTGGWNFEMGVYSEN